MVKKRGANQQARGKPFLEWCAENGERGERLANEFREELPTELTNGSTYKAKWKCLKCKHVWRAKVCNRTRSDKPTGCPMCAHNAPPSKTKNFLAWCEKNGELGKKLSREYVDKDKPPTAVTKASNYKAKWKCSNVECKHVWRAQVGRSHEERQTRRVSEVRESNAAEQDEQLPRVVREERRAREEAVARVRRQGQAADGGDERVALQGAVEV